MDKKKILNPLTGRMIDANGATAKSIKEKQKKVSVLEAVVKRKLTKKPEPPKPEPKPKRTYITKKKKEEASKVLQGAVKRTLAKKPEPKKEEASKVLQAMVKRKLAKKPEPPKPAPKKYGWEDLDEGVKDMISAYVKKNKKINYNAIRKYVMNVKKFYKINDYDLPEKEISSMKNKELYDLAYGGKLDRLIDYILDDNYMSGAYDYYDIYLYRKFNGDVEESRDKNGKPKLLTYRDYGDNLKLFNYLLNHPTNVWRDVLMEVDERYVKSDGEYDKRKDANLIAFLGDDINIDGSKNEKYEFLTLVEKEYMKYFKDEYGLMTYQPIKHKVFHIKVPRPPKEKYITPLEDFKTWVSQLENFRERGFEYNQDKSILEFKRNGALLPRYHNSIFEEPPKFEKP